MSRIDEALALWHERQDRYVQRYGPDLLKDREFSKVKLKALKRCLRETRDLNLTSGEKDDRSILKAQVRELEKKVTPNPTIRFLKKIIEKSTDAIVIAWGIGLAIRKKIQDRKKDDANSISVLTSIEPYYTGTGQQHNRTGQRGNQQQREEGQRRYSQSTPLPSDMPIHQNSSPRHQNRMETRRNNKQRSISANPTKGFGIK